MDTFPRPRHVPVHRGSAAGTDVNLRLAASRRARRTRRRAHLLWTNVTRSLSRRSSKAGRCKLEPTAGSFRGGFHEEAAARISSNRLCTQGPRPCGSDVSSEVVRAADVVPGVEAFYEQQVQRCN